MDKKLWSQQHEKLQKKEKQNYLIKKTGKLINHENIILISQNAKALFTRNLNNP